MCGPWPTALALAFPRIHKESDIAAASNLKGFLSKYIDDLDASKTALGNYNKLITPSLNQMNHGNQIVT